MSTSPQYKTLSLQEAAYTSEKKKFQKTVFGLQDSDDEDVEQEIEDTIEQLLDPKRSVKNISASEAAAVSAKSSVAAGNLAAATLAEAAKTSAADKLEMARKVAAKINLKSSSAKGVVQVHINFSSGPVKIIVLPRSEFFKKTLLF